MFHTRAAHYTRGMGLLDAVVGVALMLMVFTGISGVFQLAIELVSNNKARIGGLSLAQEQMEYIQSINYDSLGTDGGIPNGTIPQIEQVTLNGVSYTRRTLITYEDDPKDGLGVADENAVITDYKQIKVEVTWVTRGLLRSTDLVARRSPLGIEQLVPGGVLSITVVNATAQPVQGALVSVVNAATGVDTQAYTDENGLVRFLGTPVGTGYEITATKSSYSTAQTYDADATNPSPNPGHLTVANNLTTALTLAIDLSGTYTINTFEAIQEKEWLDTFSDSTKIYESASTTISGGSLFLEGGTGNFEPEGYVRAVPVSVPYLSTWREVRFSDTTPLATEVRYRLYADDIGTLVPDADLVGNAYGFTVSPIDISGLSTTTYPTLRVGATLTTLDANETPEIHSWVVAYDQGPVPFGSVPVAIIGEKTIGTNAGTPVYKFDATYTSSPGGAIDISNAEWDVYHASVDGATLGFDIAESCEPLPHTLSPGENLLVRMYFLPHTNHSLLVDVRDSLSNTLPGASVRLYRAGFSETKTTTGCGQTFYSGLSSGTLSGGDTYSIDVSLSGYTPQTLSGVEVSGATLYSVVLTTP